MKKAKSTASKDKKVIVKKMPMKMVEMYMPLVHSIASMVAGKGLPPSIDYNDLVADGAVENLGRETLSGGKYRINLEVAEPSSKLVDSIRSTNGVREVDVTGDMLVVSCDEDLRPQLARMVVDSNCLLVQMKIEEYGLEEIYMKYFRESNK